MTIKLGEIEFEVFSLPDIGVEDDSFMFTFGQYRIQGVYSIKNRRNYYNGPCWVWDADEHTLSCLTESEKETLDNAFELYNNNGQYGGLRAFEFIRKMFAP